MCVWLAWITQIFVVACCPQLALWTCLWVFSVAPTLLYTLALLLVFSSRMNHIISLILFYVPFHKCDLKNSKKKKSDENISKILGQEKLRSSNTLPVTLTCDQSDSAFIALHPLDPPPSNGFPRLPPNPVSGSGNSLLLTSRPEKKHFPVLFLEDVSSLFPACVSTGNILTQKRRDEFVLPGVTEVIKWHRDLGS